MTTLRAVVVGGVDYGEADRIVHLLTPHGRLSVFAHAAKQSRRRFAGALEPFTEIEAEVEAKKKQGLSILVHANVLRPRLGIQSALDRIGYAGYVAELGSRVAPEGEACPEIFALVESTLDRLESGAPPAPPLRRGFELRLLGPLGYRPELEACVVCGESAGFVDLIRGGALCAAHRQGAAPLGPKTRAWMQGILSQEGTLDELAGCDSEWARRAAEKISRALDALYQSLLDGPLKSTAVLEALIE